MSLLRRLGTQTFSTCKFFHLHSSSACQLTARLTQRTLSLQQPWRIPAPIAGVSVQGMSHQKDSASAEPVQTAENDSVVSVDDTENMPGATPKSKDLLASQILENLSAEESKELRKLQVEYHMWQSMGMRSLPSVMSDAQWLELLRKHPTEHSRRKVYRYWSQTEKRKEQAERKRQRVVAERKAADAMAGPEYHPAGIDAKNTYLLMVRGETVVKHHYNNLAYAACHGIPLVFDLGFDYSEREAAFVARQIKVAHGDNKTLPDPFHLHFTGVTPGSLIDGQLERFLPHFDKIPYAKSEDSYLEHYPKEKLVYLSPNAPTMLKTFDPDDVYIVGGIVDIYAEKPVTYAKAKEQKIRMASFPLDLYLKWRLGSKGLTLDQVLKIMMELKTSNDWRKAFRHAPHRKFDWR